MALTLYRLHRVGCTVRSMSISPAAKRYYRDCPCPVWVRGSTDTGVYPRQSTGLTSWVEAERLRDSLVAQSKPKEIHGPSIAECVSKYIESRQSELSSKTKAQYALVLGKLQEYARLHGIAFMRDLSVDLLESFKVEALDGLADTSKATNVAKVRRFLRDALRREWILRPLADQVTSHHAVYEQKHPVPDVEVEAILNGCLSLRGPSGYARHPKTFALLLRLMLETGMRVGDAILFDPAKLIWSESFWVYAFYPQKQKRSAKPKLIDAYVPDALKIEIDKCHWLSPALPFHYGASRNPHYLASEVYARMQTIGARVGVEDCRPHRLRDTFAARLLVKGVPIDDVSRLLGHSSVKVTEGFYAPYIQGRKARLERVLAEAVMDAGGNAGGDAQRGVLPLPAAFIGEAEDAGLTVKQFGDKLRRESPAESQVNHAKVLLKCKGHD